MSGGGVAPAQHSTVLSHWRSIVGFALLGLVLGFGWGIADQPVYRTASSVAVESDSDGSNPARLERFAQRGMSQEVATVAAGLLGGDVAGADLLSEVEVKPVPAGGALAVHAESESPDLAAAAADGFAEAMVEVEGEPLALGAAAAIPTSPVEDRPAALAAAIGGAAGAIAGLVVALALSLIRGRDRDPVAVVASSSDAPWAGRLVDPASRLDFPSAGSLAIEGRTAEEYRGIARGLGIDGPPGRRSIAVMALDGDAASTCIGLAASISSAERRVLAVETDPAGALARTLGVDAEPGLGDFLAGGSAPADVLRAITVEVESDGSRPTRSSLALIPAGRGSNADPGGDGLARLAGRLERIYDVVLYLTPPPAAGPRSAAVGRLAEGVLLVTGRATAPEALASVPSDLPVVGVVRTRS